MEAKRNYLSQIASIKGELEKTIAELEESGGDPIALASCRAAKSALEIVHVRENPPKRWSSWIGRSNSKETDKRN